jgi:hypothetical protein
VSKINLDCEDERSQLGRLASQLDVVPRWLVLELGAERRGPTVLGSLEQFEKRWPKLQIAAPCVDLRCLQKRLKTWGSAFPLIREKAPFPGPFSIAGAGFEPATSGL